jgi:hypothetical protein
MELTTTNSTRTFQLTRETKTSPKYLITLKNRQPKIVNRKSYFPTTSPKGGSK